MPGSILKFQKIVWDYYNLHGRELPWRRPEADGTFDPYKILVSEVMLQQTQVARVIPKFNTFLRSFPDIQALANAPLADVLISWNGLGYNRRAKYLQDSAKNVAAKSHWQLDDLLSCNGIGRNTAAAVLVYAYNQPVVFTETNTRSVYIHHFFKGREQVADKELLPFIEATLDRQNPRQWYWALMDYGTYLKSSAKGLTRQSKHYAKQSAFHGSSRQVRGQILRLLMNKPLSLGELQQNITDKRLMQILIKLEAEKLLTRQNSHYMLPN